MSLEHATYVMAICVGSILVWKLLHSQWPGWKGLPLVLLVLQATNDLGIAPLVSDLSGVEYKAIKLMTRTHGPEVFSAAALISLSYLAIAAGLLSVRFLPGWYSRTDACAVSQRSSPYLTKRAWYASLLLFAFGAVLNLIIISVLLRERDVKAIIVERALFSDENLVGSRAYYILQILAQSMLIGALGTVLFSGGRRWRLRAGIVAVVLTICISTVYGGRQAVVTAMLCFLLVYRYGVGPIPFRRLACYLLVCGLALGVLVYTRFGHLFSHGLAEVGIFDLLRLSLVGYCRIDDAAWVLRVVPNNMDYTGALNAIGALGRFVPSLRIPGTDTLYGYVVQHFYGGVNPYGGATGANYATGAELYSWGGWLCVALFGYLIGLFFGAIFEWQRRSSSNPFLLLLVVVVSVKIFFLGVQARMPYTITRVGIYVIFVALLAALSIPSRRIVPFVLLLWWNVVPLLAWKVFDLDFLVVLIVGSVPLGYLFAVQSLRVAGAYFSIGEPMNQPPPGALVTQP